MISLPPPVELPGEIFTQTTVPLLCESCRYLKRYRVVFNYNLITGIISPNLWLLNAVLFIYMTTLQRHPCCLHPNRDRIMIHLRRIVGYSICGILCYLCLGSCYYVAFW